MSDPATIEHKRLLRTELPGPRSLELHARRKKVVTSGVSSTFESYIERGSGAILVDVDGNQLIDLGSGIAVASIGHGHPAVAAAVAARARHSTTPASWSLPTRGTSPWLKRSTS